MPQVGILDPRNIGLAVEDALRFIQEGLELVLVAERFFQIHVSSPLAWKFVSVRILAAESQEVMELVVHPADPTRNCAETGIEHFTGKYIMFLRAEQEPQVFPHTMYKMAETYPDPHWAGSCSR